MTMMCSSDDQFNLHSNNRPTLIGCSDQMTRKLVTQTYRTTYKTPIGTTPFKLVFGKACC